MHSIGARSIPKHMRSSYLELYVLDREKARLDREIFGLDKRRSAVARHLDSVRKRIEKIEKEATQDKNIKTHGKMPAKPLKTMSIKY